MAIWFEFDFLDGQTEEIIFTFMIEAGSKVTAFIGTTYVYALKSWINEDIKNEENRLKELGL